MRQPNAERRESLDAREDTVAFDVPTGYDPAAIISALVVAGYDAVADLDNSHHLLIECPDGAREKVRDIIANQAPRSTSERESNEKQGIDEPVRFADE